MTTARDEFKKGQLIARPKGAANTNEVETGLQTLGLDGNRDGLVYVPKGYNKDTLAPLAVMLHGAGGDAAHGMQLLRQYADDKNLILLAPASRAGTWDIIAKDSFNADVIFIDQALTIIFERLSIDNSRIAIGGFSDGASYALCIGLSNGNLFTHIIAFSPGFYHTVENQGKPQIFISHGIGDRVLPIAPCSRRIVPRLKRLGYNVAYEEFNGEHEIPPTISAHAVNWFAG